MKDPRRRQELGVDAKAQKFVAEMDAKLTAAEKQTATIKERKRILFVLSTQASKILASGKRHGWRRHHPAVKAVEGFTSYKQMTDEAIVTAKPDLILAMKNAGSPMSRDELFANRFIAIASTPCGHTRVRTRHRDVRGHPSGDGAVAGSRPVLTGTSSVNRG
ncbi:ABC transporter substrate-binding protein [Mesorhizobium caraganae]|uniref:ABC transporter substrate-binding protein n=1 Tax=Mesorhizobium caraganae TaxID=483206 RepID=UPI001FE6682E|nr:ABC transporter substrate-binding protein [Mesorhizobium caraganae]